MSNDQLSWEQLLKATSEPDPQPNATVGDAPQASAGESNETPKKKRARKTKVTDTVSVVQESVAVSSGGVTETISQTNVVQTTAQTVQTVQTKTVESETPRAKAQASVTVVESRSHTSFEGDFVDEEPQSEEPKVISVSELNRYIRQLLEGQFAALWLKGEISNFKAHTSGHFYFSLKDSKAQISAVMFRGYNTQLRFRPEDGMEVLVRGKITVYEPRGNYQIFCESMEPVGAGALQKAFEQLKEKLNKEGLFDPARKRPLPALPKHIAIVTSPTGAAIRDMLNVLGRRFKGACITVIPCKVQGDQAPREIIEAIRLANSLKDVDVMIVGRGGGSIEDLWAFNNEGVARAIASCRVPVISAVGHEVDFTIADFVADLRAPTPSAAAELVVRSAADLLEGVRGLARSLQLSMFTYLKGGQQYSQSLSRRLVDPQRRIQDASIRCDELSQRLQSAAQRGLQNRRMEIALLQEKIGTPLPRISHSREVVSNFGLRLRGGMRQLLLRRRDQIGKQMAVLDSLSPLKVLDRGYSMVVQGDRIVTDATTLAVGDQVTVRMCNGAIDAQVTRVATKR